MAIAAEVIAKIGAAAATLAECGQGEVADALQLVLTGVDDLPAAMGLAPGWRVAVRYRHAMRRWGAWPNTSAPAPR